MKNEIQVGHEPKQNWFIKMIKKYPLITFTIGFLFLGQLVAVVASYFADKSLFIERYGLNIWFWAIGIPIIYFFQWLLVVYVASKLPREKLKQKFLRHPVATIILFILFITDLPYRLAEYGGGGGWFETILYYGFLAFLWWLLVCWISSKIFKKQRFQWHWYQKAIEKIFIFLPIAYKIVFGLILAIIIFFIIFYLITVVFKYSGQDLKMLFS